MFQAIYNVHLKDRLRGKRLIFQSDGRHFSYHHFAIAAKQREELIRITNLFILATAALATVIPRDSSSLAAVHQAIETINSDLAATSQDTKDFDVEAILIDLQNISSVILRACYDVADSNYTVNETEALILIYYVKNAMQPAIDETMSDLKKVKSRLSRAGSLDEVARELEDLGKYTVLLGSALWNKAPTSKKPDAQETLDGVLSSLKDLVMCLRS